MLVYGAGRALGLSAGAAGSVLWTATSLAVYTALALTLFGEDDRHLAGAALRRLARRRA
jgi:hypothetical protein